MTAQMTDLVRFSDFDWSLAGANGEALFEPAAVGLEVQPAHTACWRGYVATYCVRDDQFLLEDLLVASKHDPPPALFGIAPTGPDPRGSFTAVYRSISRKMPFTGGLLLGRELIRELYVHMGFHPAWKYRHVVELQLDSGQVIRTTDRSDAMAEARSQFAGKDHLPDRATSREIAAWKEVTFSLKY